MLKRLMACGLGFGVALAALPALAESAQNENCAARDQVVNRLQEHYSEQLTAGGFNGAADKTTLVEVWASPETGTFTVMLTNAQGLSCIVATGTDWYAHAPLPQPRGTSS